MIRFLSKLDRALQFKDQEIHETNLRALDAVLANQFPNGAWAQGFETLGPEDRYPVKPGEFPQDWSRQQPKQDYWTFYTLNDNALVRIIDTLWLAHDIYGDDRYKRAALRGADFLVLAQMPDPQPAWAQQYDFEMHPTWARKFEPPSISGRESQDAVECLMMTYVRTGEDRYKPPIERALRYLATCVTAEGKIPRFLELKTNRPLFFTREYQLTYSDSDLPTHYSFLGPNDVPRLNRQWEKLRSLPADALASFREKQQRSRSRERPSEEVIRKMIDNMRADGAWIESGKLRYIKASDHNGRVISSTTFIQNLESLSRFLAP